MRLQALPGGVTLEACFKTPQDWLFVSLRLLQGPHPLEQRAPPMQSAVTWGIARNAESQARPVLPAQNLQANKTPSNWDAR